VEEKKKEIIYVLEEEAYLKYFLRVEQDRKIISQLLFGGNINDVSETAKNLLCEYYAAIKHFEDTLDEIVDNNLFDKKTKSYIVSGEEALKFTVLLQSLVVIKEELLVERCSISLH